jgi:tRNA (cmo5U34)-methyltransferase
MTVPTKVCRSYLETIRAEVPAYDELQDAVAEATAGIHAERVLELGVGTGKTSRRVLGLHPDAELVGIDESAGMLAAASAVVVAADLRVSRLEDPFAGGHFRPCRIGARRAPPRRCR